MQKTCFPRLHQPHEALRVPAPWRLFWQAFSACAVMVSMFRAPNAHATSPLPFPLVEPPQSAAQCLLNAAAPGECRETGYRAWLRRKAVRECDLAKYGLQLEDGCDQSDPMKPVVIMIHGFNSSPEQNSSLMAPIRAAGFPCGTF